MLNLWRVLKDIGKGLEHVGQWVDVGLRVAEPIIALIDPPLEIIIQEVDEVLEELLKSGPVTEQSLQAIVTSFATVHAVKSVLPTSAPVASSAKAG